MYTKDDIIARLRKGENLDDIANAMTKELNAAKTAYDKEEAERKAKEEAEHRNHAAARTAMAKVADALIDYLEVVCPEAAAECKKDVPEALNEMTEMLETGAKEILDLYEAEKNTKTAKVTIRKDGFEPAEVHVASNVATKDELKNLENKIKKIYDEIDPHRNMRSADEVLSNFVRKFID